MTDSTNNLGPAARLERIIAIGDAARTPVDSQGRPTGSPATFTYDEDGRFVSVTRGEPDDPA
jgi:hypothetical protein